MKKVMKNFLVACGVVTASALLVYLMGGTVMVLLGIPGVTKTAVVTLGSVLAVLTVSGAAVLATGPLEEDDEDEMAAWAHSAPRELAPASAPAPSQGVASELMELHARWS